MRASYWFHRWAKLCRLHLLQRLGEVEARPGSPGADAAPAEHTPAAANPSASNAESGAASEESTASKKDAETRDGAAREPASVSEEDVDPFFDAEPPTLFAYDAGPPPPFPWRRPRASDGYDDEDLAALKRAGDYRFGALLARLDNTGLDVPASTPDRDNDWLVVLLRGSVSLGYEEKRELLGRLGSLSRPQFEALRALFEHEHRHFANLSPKHLSWLQLRELLAVLEWRLLQMEAREEV